MIQPIIVIEKQKKLKLINFSELVSYKDLLYFLVVRGIKARYAQSVLGVGWAVIQPLSTMLVFTVVFGRLARIDSDGIPYALFSFCGLVPWLYFSGVLNDAPNSLLSNVNMISKVYFPRLILPLSAVISKLLDFAITLLVLSVLLIVYQVAPSKQLIFFPVLVVLLVIASFGPSILLAAWSVQYRDIKYAIVFIVQILMYAAPVVYPLSIVPEEFRMVYSINPMVGIIEGFRSAVLGATQMPWKEIGMGSIFSVGLLLVGLRSFSRLERTFADVV